MTLNIKLYNKTPDDSALYKNIKGNGVSVTVGDYDSDGAQDDIQINLDNPNAYVTVDGKKQNVASYVAHTLKDAAFGDKRASTNQIVKYFKKNNLGDVSDYAKIVDAGIAGERLAELQTKLDSLKTEANLSNATQEVADLLKNVPGGSQNEKAWQALTTAYNNAFNLGNTALARALLEVLKPYTDDSEDWDGNQTARLNILDKKPSNKESNPSQPICVDLTDFKTTYAPNDQDPDWSFYNTNWQNYCTTTPPPPGGKAREVTPEHGFDWGAVGAGGSASVLVTSLGLFLPRSYLVPLSLLEGALGGGLTALLNDNQQQVPVWHSIWQGAGSALLGHGIGFFTKNPLINMLFTGIGMGAVSFGWEAARNNSFEGSIWDTIKQSASSTFTREAMVSMFLSSMIGSFGGTMHNIRRQTPWHVGFGSPHTGLAERVYTHHRAIDRALLTGSELPGPTTGTTTDPFQYQNTHNSLAQTASSSPSRSGYQAREAFNGPRDVRQAITEDLAVARKKLEAIKKRDAAINDAGTDAEASSVAVAKATIDALPITPKEKTAAQKVLDDQVTQAREKVEAKRQQEAEEQAQRTRELQQQAGQAADAYLARARALIATSAEPKNMTLGQLMQHSDNIATECRHYADQVRGDASTHLPDRVAELDDTLNALVKKTENIGQHIHNLQRNLAYVTGLGETSPLTEVGTLTSPNQVSEFLRSKGIARAVNDLASLNPDTSIPLTSPRLGGSSSNSTPAQHLRDISRFLTEQMSTPEFAASPNAREVRHAVRDEVLRYAGTNKETVIAAGESHPLYKLATVGNDAGAETGVFPVTKRPSSAVEESLPSQEHRAPERAAHDPHTPEELLTRGHQTDQNGGPEQGTRTEALSEDEQAALLAEQTGNSESSLEPTRQTPPPGSLGNARLSGEPGTDSLRLGGREQEPSPTIDEAYTSHYGEYNPRQIEGKPRLQIGTNDGRHAEVLGRLVEEPRATLEQAQAHLESASQNHKEATDEVRRLAREVQDLEAQTPELQAWVTQAEENASSATKAFQNVEQKISHPRGNIPTEQGYVDDYTTLLKDATQAQSTAEAKLAQAKAEQAQAKKALAAARGKATKGQISNSDVNPYNEKADAANARVQEAEQALADAKALVEENRAGLEQSQANLARYTAELETLNPEFEKASAARVQALNQRNEATAALQANKAQVESAKTGLKGAQRRTRVAERKLATAQSDVTSAQDRYNNALGIRDNARNQLAGEIPGLEAQVAAARSQNLLAGQKAKTANTRLGYFESELTKLNDQALPLETQAEQATSRARELRQASDEAKTALAEAQSALIGKTGINKVMAEANVRKAESNATAKSKEAAAAEQLAQTQREQAEAARRAANEAQEKALAARANADAANRARDEANTRLSALQTELQAIRG